MSGEIVSNILAKLQWLLHFANRSKKRVRDTRLREEDTYILFFKSVDEHLIQFTEEEARSFWSN